jgi:hypothetical protein
MTTSQEIKQHFGQKGLNLVKETFGYSNLRELNKDEEISRVITYMVFSWYVDYGKKKWKWSIQDLINEIEDTKNISKISNEEFVVNFF